MPCALIRGPALVLLVLLNAKRVPVEAALSTTEMSLRADMQDETAAVDWAQSTRRSGSGSGAGASNYQLKTSGTCASHGCIAVSSQTECNTAANALSLSDQTSSWAPTGPGCFLYGQRLNWNPYATSSYSISSGQRCLCNCNSGYTSGGSPGATFSDSFSMVTSGTCETNGCYDIGSGTECNAAARSLSLRDTTSTYETDNNYPQGCYQLNTLGGVLYFNTHPYAIECSSGARCICRGGNCSESIDAGAVVAIIVWICVCYVCIPLGCGGAIWYYFSNRQRQNRIHMAADPAAAVLAQQQLGTHPSQPYSMPAPPTHQQAGGEWKTAQDPSTGRTYQYNTVTNETRWETPAPAAGMAPTPAPPPVPAPAPQGEWRSAQDPNTGRTYQYNTVTNETRWDDAAPTATATGPLPSGWEEATTKDGRPYYFNSATSESQFHRPT